MTPKKVDFILTHADKVALDTSQLKLYMTVCKLLKKELNRISRISNE